MSFNGQYQLVSQEGFKEFMKATGLDHLYEKENDVKYTYEIKENGDNFEVTTTAGDKVVTNIFTIGEQTQIELIQGQPVEVVVNRDGKNLKTMMKKISVVWAMEDADTLVITLSTPDNIAYRRISKRIA